MKPLTIVLLCVLSGAAQTAELRPTKSLAELARDITPDGTIPLINKRIPELTVSDLPDASKDPLSINTTFKCQTLEKLTIANEQQHGAIAALVPEDVLENTLNAASGCLALHLIALQEDHHEFVIAAVAAMVDANAEIHRREYNRLVEQYSALLVVARDLQRQLLTVQKQAAQQQRVSNALALYQLMPKYAPPQTINLQISDCTRLPALCAH